MFIYNLSLFMKDKVRFFKLAFCLIFLFYSFAKIYSEQQIQIKSRKHRDHPCNSIIEGKTTVQDHPWMSDPIDIHG